MEVPEGVKTYETDIGIFWFDRHGILYQVSKATPRTLENVRAHIELVKKIAGNKKTCALVDCTNAAPSDKQVRDYYSAELPPTCKALAILSGSYLGSMLANILISLKGQTVPMKIFRDEKKAIEWLKQYLGEGVGVFQENKMKGS